MLNCGVRTFRQSLFRFEISFDPWWCLSIHDQFCDNKMAELNGPHGVFVSNGEIFFADTLNHRVRKVLRNGQIVTICGTGIQGYNGDGQLATNAQLDLRMKSINHFEMLIIH